MTLKDIVKQQELFLTEQTILTLMLLSFKNNVEEFDLLFSKEIEEYYKIDFSNPEYVWESLSELCSDFVNKDKSFCSEENGLFATLHFAKPKKKKLNEKEMIEFFTGMSQGPWSI